jgi:hypothetical protein
MGILILTYTRTRITKHRMQLSAPGEKTGVSGGGEHRINIRKLVARKSERRTKSDLAVMLIIGTTADN